MKKHKKFDSRSNSNILSSNYQFYDKEQLDDVRKFYISNMNLVDEIFLSVSTISDPKEKQIVKEWLKKFHPDKYALIMNANSNYVSKKELKKEGLVTSKHDEYLINFYIAMMANELEKEDIVFSYLQEITNNFEFYYKNIKNNNTEKFSFLKTVTNVIKCLKPEFQLKFIEENKESLKEDPSITYIYAELLIKNNKLDDAVQIIEHIQECKKENVDYQLKVVVLYRECLTKNLNVGSKNNHDEAYQKYGIKICQQLELVKSLNNEEQHQDLYYHVLLHIIYSLYRCPEKISNASKELKEFEKLLYNTKNNESKKFLLFLNNASKNNLHESDCVEFKKINKNEINKALISEYKYFDLLFKYSKGEINEVNLFIDLGSNDNSILRIEEKIEICMNLEQLNLAKKYISSCKIENFSDKEYYFWIKYTLLSIDQESMIKEINDYIEDNIKKAELFHRLAIHYAIDKLDVSLFFIEHLKEIKFNRAELPIAKKIIQKAAKLVNVCKSAKKNENGKKQISLVEEKLKKENVKDIDKNDKETVKVEDKNKNERSDDIKNSPESKIEHENLAQIDKKSLVSALEPAKDNSISNQNKDEPDFSEMSTQAIYDYFESKRIADLSSKERIIYLKGKRDKIAAQYQKNNILKKDKPWHYKGKAYYKPNKDSSESPDKNTCYELNHTLPNGQFIKKCYIIIDPDIENKFTDLRAIKQALNKQILGSHKQNGVMKFKSGKGGGLIKITTDRDERGCVDLITKNDEGETLYIVNKYFSNHKEADRFFNKSDGFHLWTDEENYANLAGNSTNFSSLEEG